MKCCYKDCKSPATYDSPKPLCDKHWAAWWARTMPDRKQAYREVREFQKKEYKN